MDVALIADSKYALQTAVTIQSLLNTNSRSISTIHLLTTGIQDGHKKKLESICKNHQIQFIVYDVNESSLDIFDGLSDWSKYTCLKLLIPNILPDSINQILYLDSDILVLDDISPIMRTIETAVAGVDDIPFSHDHLIRCNLSENAYYINSGVMVLNLKKWRHVESSARIHSLITSKRGSTVSLNDQDIISIIFNGDISLLPYNYNVTNAYWGINIPIIKENKDIWKRVRRNPHIIHFTNWRKPWKQEISHPFKRKYLSILKQTPFEIADEDKKIKDYRWYVKNHCSDIFCRVLDLYRTLV